MIFNMNHWLVGTGTAMIFLFSQKYKGLLINHPNWRTHIVQRGFSPTTNQITKLNLQRWLMLFPSKFLLTWCCYQRKRAMGMAMGTSLNKILDMTNVKGRFPCHFKGNRLPCCKLGNPWKSRCMRGLKSRMFHCHFQLPAGAVEF